MSPTLVNAETKAWAGQRGIVLEVTAPYSQFKNGVAERFNCTHMELARAVHSAQKNNKLLSKGGGFGDRLMFESQLPQFHLLYITLFLLKLPV